MLNCNKPFVNLCDIQLYSVYRDLVLIKIKLARDESSLSANWASMTWLICEIKATDKLKGKVCCVLSTKTNKNEIFFKNCNKKT